MDVEIILNAAEIEASGMRDVVWRFPESEAWHISVAFELTRPRVPGGDNPSCTSAC